jgi:hypothetical protein
MPEIVNHSSFDNSSKQGESAYSDIEIGVGLSAGHVITHDVVGEWLLSLANLNQVQFPTKPFTFLRRRKYPLREVATWIERYDSPDSGGLLPPESSTVEVSRVRLV